MNDLRKELERQFKTFGFYEPNEKTVETISENDTAAETERKPLAAPGDFDPEYAAAFGELSPKWQNYLCKRDEKLKAERKEISAKLALLNSLNGFDDVFQKRRLNDGISSFQEWLEGLVYVDEQIHSRPAKTLEALAKVFHVNAQFSEIPQTEFSNRILNRLAELDASFHNLKDYLQQRQNGDFNSRLQAFGAQKDENGRSLYPYFEAVYNQMRALLQGGLAASFEDAYKQAVWLDADIRKELIAKKINSDAGEAQKAQKATFSPKGKAKAPERPLTLREEIEKNMAAFLD